MDGRVFTTGLEIETDIIRADILDYFIRRTIDSKFINYHKDASSEFPTVSIKGLQVINRSPSLFKDFMQYSTGVEVVTGVLTPEQTPDIVEKLLIALTLAGELKTSVRGSTHIHIGFPNYYDWVYNFFVLSVYLESFFFNIGGMGSGFRGQFNESIYCRPLTSPPCFSWNNSYFKLFNYKKMLESKPTEDLFWKIFLHQPGQGPIRYPPGRYLYVNFVSLISHGTLELRILNNTLNPDFLNSVISLFRNICQLSIYIPNREVEHLKACLTDSNHEKLEVLLELISKYNILEEVGKSSLVILHHLIDRTPNYKPRDNILSHVWDKTRISEEFMSKNLLEYRQFIHSKPALSGFMDTHQRGLYEFDRLEQDRVLCAS